MQAIAPTAWTNVPPIVLQSTRIFARHAFAGGVLLEWHDVTKSMTDFATLHPLVNGEPCPHASFPLFRYVAAEKLYLFPRALAVAWFPNMIVLEIPKPVPYLCATCPRKPLVLSVVLDAEQRAAVSAVCDVLLYDPSHGALLTQPCGTGKTLAAHAVAIEMGQRRFGAVVPIVVFVFDNMQKRQWIERAKTYCGATAQIGVLQGKQRPKPTDNIVICMYNTVCGLGDALALEYFIDAVAVFDEAHMMVSRTRVRGILDSVPCKYRLALTATPLRGDRMEAGIRYCVGPHAYATVRSNWSLDVRVLPFVCDPPFEWPVGHDGKIDYTLAVTKLFSHPAFIATALAVIQQLVRVEGFRVLVMCQRLDLLRQLYLALGPATSGLLIGGGTAAQHEDAKRKDVCLASEKIVRQSLDASFTCILPLSSIAFMPQFEQAIGRLTRGSHVSAPSAGPEIPICSPRAPLIFDLYLASGPMLAHHKRRLKFCQEKGFQVFRANADGSQGEEMRPAPAATASAGHKRRAASIAAAALAAAPQAQDMDAWVQEFAVQTTT